MPARAPATIRFAPVAEDDPADLDLWADGACGTAEAMEILGVSKPTLYALMDSGEVPYSQPRDGARRRVSRRGLKRYLARHAKR